MAYRNLARPLRRGRPGPNPATKPVYQLKRKLHTRAAAVTLRPTLRVLGYLAADRAEHDSQHKEVYALLAAGFVMWEKSLEFIEI